MNEARIITESWLQNGTKLRLRTTEQAKILQQPSMFSENSLENCGFFLAILVKTDTAFKPSRSYIAARFRPLMLYIINYNLFQYFGEEPLIGTEFIES